MREPESNPGAGRSRRRAMIVAHLKRRGISGEPVATNGRGGPVFESSNDYYDRNRRRSTRTGNARSVRT